MATVITIASGKGGVGKSSLATNFALRLQKSSGRALLVDSDLLMANSHILLDLQPEFDLIDVLQARCTLREAIEVVDGGLSVLAGRTGASVAIDKVEDPLQSVLSELRQLKDAFSYIVVDAPAGAGQDLINTLANSDRVLIVLLAQATSFVDAYALIKNSYLERGIAEYSVVVNMVNSERQARAVFENFSYTVKAFLPVGLTYAGHFKHRREIYESSIKCVPIVQMEDKHEQIKNFDLVLRQILHAPHNALRHDPMPLNISG
ncbi:AAA family ATPase [Marivita sp.]|uniref:AAA family ATPase n=1 Tax=Marivita sp. TaxID=2003365 RepID=UPI0025BEAB00|nr:AAA family ATPase [Marivita sp.]